jgi:hypothetical protein
MSEIEKDYWLIWSRRKAQTADALAARGDEGRGSMRKALVSRQTGDDPKMSEWGNPMTARSLSLPEYIG